MSRLLLIKVLLAGARSAWTQSLLSQAWADWDDPAMKYARDKYKNGSSSSEAKSFHLTKNIGQELYQVWNTRDDLEQGGEDGKTAYKVSSFLILASGVVGIIVGALPPVVYWIAFQ